MSSPRSDRIDDEDTSSVSDYDSEWTQVSGTEDEGENESDFLPLSVHGDRPLSRAGSSVDGDVWEGFTEDAQSQPEEAIVELNVLTIDVDDFLPDAPVATEDDVQISNALNSSLAGTLRSRSRSAAGSLQSSMTESHSQSKLRLSFPDPLEKQLASSPVASPVGSVLGEHFQSCSANESMSSFADVEAASTSIVSEPPDQVIQEVPLSYLLSVVLYGSPSSSKWRIAELAMKAIVQREHTSFTERLGRRNYYFEELNDTFSMNSAYIQVIDRTMPGQTEEEIDGLSLAVLVLSGNDPQDVPLHTMYLPVLNYDQEPLSIEDSVAPRDVAEHLAKCVLRNLDIPRELLAAFYPENPDAIIDIGQLANVEPRNAAKAFKRLSLGGKPQKLSDVIPPVSIKLTLLAIVSVVVAAIVSDMSSYKQLSYSSLSEIRPLNASGSETRATTLESTIFSGHSRENAVAIHQTSLHAVASVASSSSSKTPSKTPVAAVPPAANSPAALKVLKSQDAQECACHTKQSWSSGLKETTDLLIRAIPAVPMKITEGLVPMVIPKLPNGLMVRETKASSSPVRKEEERPIASASISAESSISTFVQEVYDAAFTVGMVGKTILVDVSDDLRALHDACDELLIAVARQVGSLLSQAPTIISDELVTRNKRAAKNAKRVRRWLESEILEPAKAAVELTIEGAKQVHGQAISAREARRKVRETKKEHIVNKDASTKLSDKKMGHKQVKRKSLK